MKILIVEDAPMAAKVLQNQLGSLGYRETEVVSSAEAALTLLDQKEFDLVIVDWGLPLMKGPELIELIRMDHRLKNVSTVMFTGKGEAEHVLRAMEAGAEDYILKPATRDVLKVKLEAVLRRKQAEP